MNQRTEIDQAKANLLKIARSAIRLKHSLAADDELNKMLPEIEKEFFAVVHRSELPDPAQLVEFLDA